MKELDLANPDRSEFKLNLDKIEEEFDEGVLDQYYFYDGSLTTPGCDQIINWMVMENPLSMSKD